MSKALKDKKYKEFLADLLPIMAKHKVKDLLLISEFEGRIRNSVLSEKDNDTLNNISDGIDTWLRRTNFTPIVKRNNG